MGESEDTAKGVKNAPLLGTTGGIAVKGEAWAPSYPKSQILTEDSLLSLPNLTTKAFPT